MTTAMEDLVAAAEMAASKTKDGAMLGNSGYERIEADFYPTPPEFLDCLLEHVHLHDRVWEPACGNGALSKALSGYGYNVTSTDLFDYGFPGAIIDSDFLAAEEVPDGVRTILTNPPYGDMVEQFIRKGLELTKPVRGQVCLFLRNEYDTSSGRQPLFANPPFHKKIICTKRPRWIADSKGSPRHSYAWYVWDWRHIRGDAAVKYSHPDHAIPLTRVN